MEEQKKTVKKVSQKYLYVLIGVLGIVLLTGIMLSIGVFFAVRYSPSVQDVFTKFLENSNITLEEKKIVITNEESNIVEIVAESSPSVVSIAVSKLALTQDRGLVDESSNIGTGFIVDSEGIIITNQHVVSDLSAEYKVVTYDGVEYDVVEVLRDDLNDLAIIKVEPKNGELKALSLGDSDLLLVGQSVIAIGTPLGEYAGSVTRGIVSGLNRSVTAGTDWFGSTSKTYEDVIQTDAAVNPGNSGGPLLNSQGEVIGINFATTSGADNISFAIPINKVKARLEEYRTYGKFIRPYLGVTYQMISEYDALYYTDVVPGALILKVEASSPASTAGLERGDIITKFGEIVVVKSLAEIIQMHEVGEEVELKVTREGEEKILKVALGEMD